MPLTEDSHVAVSFVVPARNEAEGIGACVDCLQRQDLDVPFEVVVVDNGSSDDTAVIARAHGARVVSEPRAGLANARQAGLDAARGEYLVYVDADTHLPARWTQDALRIFAADADLVAISPKFYFHDGRLVDRLGNAVFHSLLNPLTNLVLTRIGRPGVLIGSTIALRTAALRNANGVDLNFQFYGEDTMLAHRMHTQGRVRFVQQPTLHTSARRYQDRGILHVVYRYFLIFALIHLGNIDLAAQLADRFHECDRGLRSRNQCRRFLVHAWRGKRSGPDRRHAADSAHIDPKLSLDQ